MFKREQTEGKLHRQLVLGFSVYKVSIIQNKSILIETIMYKELRKENEVNHCGAQSQSCE